MEEMVAMSEAAPTARPEALRVALAYYDAWTAREFDRAMTFIAEDIVCDTPGGRLLGCDELQCSQRDALDGCWPVMSGCA
jgi:hypothetical protein